MSDLATVPQIMLDGQAAAAPGPVPMHAMYIMHGAFRRDLELFVEAAAATPVADRGIWRLLARRWSLFSDALHKHHSAEDSGLWPLLRERASEAELADLNAMESEHATIDPLLELCRSHFEHLADHPDEDARHALRAALRQAQAALGDHLAHEERDAMAILQRHLTVADWQRVERQHFRRGVGPRDVLRAVPWAMHGLPDHARNLAFAEPGGVIFRALWRLTRRRFATNEQRTFRHASSPAAPDDHGPSGS